MGDAVVVLGLASGWYNGGGNDKAPGGGAAEIRSGSPSIRISGIVRNKPVE